ncbi:MAG: peptide ABC transporter substrate-binding protein [Chloroflexota bacterium]
MRRLSNKLLNVGVASAFAAGLALSAHAPVSHARGAQAALKTLRLDYLDANKGKLAKTLDPALVTSATAADIIDLAQANFVKISTNNKIVPDLATWSVSKNHKVYTFTIRKGAKFNDGKPVTAQDAVWSMTRSLLPSTASDVASSYMGFIKGATELNTGKATTLTGVKAIGKNKVQITLTDPIAFFLYTLSYPTSDILEKSALEGKTASATGNYLTSNCPANNHGAGPFKFVCSGDAFFPAGQTPSYTLVPSKYYYGKKAHVKLTMRSGPDLDTGYKTYLAGGVDMTGIPTADIAKWRGNKQYREYATSVVRYITPNTTTAPFSDVHCRMAVQYGLDRETVVHTILHNATHTYYGVVPKGFLGYINLKKLIGYNPAKAKSEFQKCALKSTPVSLKYPTGSTDADNTYAAYTQQLQAVGFNIKAQPLAANDWLNVVGQDLNKTSTQIVSNGWQQDYPDPQDYVELLLKSDQNYDIGKWKNATFDKLAANADTDFNKKKRAALYAQAQKIALTQGAWIPLTNSVGHGLIKSYVHGLTGTVAYADFVPVGQDWSKVTVTR